MEPTRTPKLLITPNDLITPNERGRAAVPSPPGELRGHEYKNDTHAVSSGTKSVLGNLSTILSEMFPFSGIKFIAKNIEKSFDNLVLKIQLAVSCFFKSEKKELPKEIEQAEFKSQGSKETVETVVKELQIEEKKELQKEIAVAESKSIRLTELKQGSEETGETVVKELLKGKKADVDQFKKDFARGDYFWDKLQINDDGTIQGLMEHFTSQGFVNMSRLFVQSLSADIISNMNNLYQVNFTVPARVIYKIQEEGDQIKMTVTYIVSQGDMTEDGEKINSNFFRVTREITMSKEDFQKNWFSVEDIPEIAPSLKIEDTYSKDITVQEAHEYYKDTKRHKFEIIGDKIIDREI
jgi:hypothetical protein